MKKRWLGAALLLLGGGAGVGELGFDVAFGAVGAGRVAMKESASNASISRSESGLPKLLSEASDLCAVAKAAYSPKYGSGCRNVDGEFALSAEEAARLTEEERVYFGEICDAFRERLAALPGLDASEAFETAKFHLAEMKYCQPNSPFVAKLNDRVRSLFSEENFFLEIDEETLAATSRRKISDDVAVNESIRGTWAVGAGSVVGETTVDLRPNPNQAEIQIVLNADVSTSTVGTNRGVRVYSDNFGKVVASKSIFFCEDGLRTTPSVSNGSMKSRVKRVDPGNLPLLFNGVLLQKKMGRELPLSERESGARMSARVAAELDAEANARLVEFNSVWNRARGAVAEDKRILRQISSRTDDDRLYFSCLISQKEQFASPTSELTRSAEGTSLASAGAVQARSAGRYSATVAAVERPAVVLKAHQSAPNNAAFVALAGLSLGDEGMFNKLVERFPGLDRKVAAGFLEKYRRHNSSEGESVADRDKLYVEFDAERPFDVAFSNDKVETTLRFSKFETGARSWPELEIKFAYKIERRGDGVVLFKRELVDVLPGGLAEDAPIPARFQAFRSVVMKRLEGAILDEYVADEIPLRAGETGESLGTLVPTSATARDGWFVAEFDFKPSR